MRKIINSIFFGVFVGGIVELVLGGIPPYAAVYTSAVILLSLAVLIGSWLANARGEARKSYNHPRRYLGKRSISSGKTK